MDQIDHKISELTKIDFSMGDDDNSTQADSLNDFDTFYHDMFSLEDY